MLANSITPFILGYLALLGPTGPQDLDRSEVSLCEALGSIRRGERVPVVVSGVYGFNYLYDPDEPSCQWDVDPTTCVEFAKGVDPPERFWILHRESNRVFVTFQGTLHGPGLDPQMRAPDLPVAARLAAAGRMWHCGWYRTKLVVDSVVDFKPVPPSVPWPEEKVRDKQKPPSPTSLEPPAYPRPAVNLDLEGDVKLEVEVTEGLVSAVRVQFGDPVLVEAAAANARSWKFAPETYERISVEYQFRLERRTQAEGHGTRLELELPSKVRVIGARRGW